MAYSEDNIFAKILDGKLPSLKIFETEHALAILDAFPVAPGHALLVCKARGARTLAEMSDVDAARYLADLPRLVRAVTAATGAAGVNVLQNNGDAAGQVVFHPHFHVVPRSDGDGVLSLPEGSKTMLSAEEAAPLLAKLHAAAAQ